MNVYSPRRLTPWLIVVVGLIALAIAMGIGRFAFTPLLPLMLRDGTLDVTRAAEWAIANYIGYLIGALTAAGFIRDPQRGLCLGLLGVALTTVGMGWANSSPNLLGIMLRGSAGVFSAWVLVCASSWSLSELARKQSTHLAGWIYTGVGLGIAITGTLTWLSAAQTAKILWIESGALSAIGLTFVVHNLPKEKCIQDIDIANKEAIAVNEGNHSRSHFPIVLCYSAFGFGYIIPATFLPTMARQLVSDPFVFGMMWPIFGAAAVLSVALVTHWLSAWPRQKVWATAQGAMALGTLLPLLHQALWVLAASALLVGGTFMLITMAGLQLARERLPANPTRLLAQMTAGFATGQIAGPMVVRFIGSNEIAGWDALSWANAIATTLLAMTAFWLWRNSIESRA